MEFNKRHSISPPMILDVDNGIDFTFKGMGLRGNKIKITTIIKTIKENNHYSQYEYELSKLDLKELLLIFSDSKIESNFKIIVARIIHDNHLDKILNFNFDLIYNHWNVIRWAILLDFKSGKKSLHNKYKKHKDWRVSKFANYIENKIKQTP